MSSALRQALADGVIDCVATDHAPHAEQEKCCEFANARPGMLGLQTALSVVVADHGAARPADLARCRPGDERGARPPSSDCPIRAARWRSGSRPT